MLVPWAGSAEDHQTLNVTWLSDAGAAVHLAESDIGNLGGVLDDLRADEPRRTQLGRRAAELGEVHRSGALAELIESVAAGANGPGAVA